jgi:hypothetical protein
MFESFFDHYVQAAAELGLVLDPPDPQIGDPIVIRGTLDGVEVELHQAPYKMYTSALLRPPGTLGVSIATMGLLGKVGHLFGSGHGGVGDPSFDDVFRAKAGDPAMLTTAVSPELRAALLAAVAAGLHPSVDDRAVQLWHQADDGMMESVAEIARSLREAARIARIASVAFAQATPPRG